VRALMRRTAQLRGSAISIDERNHEASASKSLCSLSASFFPSNHSAAKVAIASSHGFMDLIHLNTIIRI